MTKEELKEKHANIQCSIGVGPGWYELVDNFCKELKVLDEDCCVTCIKEKFGLLRIYTSFKEKKVDQSVFDKVMDLEVSIENDSKNVCENCGSKNDVTTQGGWLKTLCKNCRNDQRKD